MHLIISRVWVITTACTATDRDVGNLARQKTLRWLLIRQSLSTYSHPPPPFIIQVYFYSWPASFITYMWMIKFGASQFLPPNQGKRLCTLFCSDKPVAVVNTYSALLPIHTILMGCELRKPKNLIKATLRWLPIWHLLSTCLPWYYAGLKGPKLWVKSNHILTILAKFCRY